MRILHVRDTLIMTRTPKLSQGMQQLHAQSTLHACAVLHRPATCTMYRHAQNCRHQHIRRMRREGPPECLPLVDAAHAGCALGPLDEHHPGQDVVAAFQPAPLWAPVVQHPFVQLALQVWVMSLIREATQAG